MRLIWIIGLLSNLGLCLASDWTWSYRKNFDGSELQSLANKAHVTFTKLAVPPFQQLIFSWNAHRPSLGYFGFYVQSRDSHTKRWSHWYKVAEWGAAVQRTHLVRQSGDDPTNHYVRFEQSPGHLADSFRLKVEAHYGASLSELRSLDVTVSDFSNFRTEVGAELVQRLSPIQLRGVPLRSQMDLTHEDHFRMCSPTALSMLVNYVSGELNFDAVEFAKSVYDHGLETYGSWPFNAAQAFVACPRHSFRVTRLKSFAALHRYLKQQRPVVVSVRGYLDGAPKEYLYGHFLIIIGWDPQNKTIICHDPAIKGDCNVRCTYHINDFLRGWEKSHRLAYVVE